MGRARQPVDTMADGRIASEIDVPNTFSRTGICRSLAGVENAEMETPGI
jgi:hypothetical protein